MTRCGRSRSSPRVPAYGGAERYLTLLAAELARRGPVVAYSATSRRPRRTPRWPGRARRCGWRGLAPRGAGGAAGLVAELARLRPRLAHVNLCDQGDGLGAIAAAWAAGVPRTATLHLAFGDRPAAYERLAHVALRRVAPVIAVSDGVGAYLDGIGVPFRVVRNGVPAPSPRPGGRAALWDGEPPSLLVGGIGRLHDQKGWDVLCDAAPAIRAAVPGWRSR